MVIVLFGDKVDVDFSDCFDFFFVDSGMWVILFYIEFIDNVKKFMLVVCVVVCVKFVVVIKVGWYV